MRRVACGVLVLCMLAGLWGCGQGAEPEEMTTQSTTTEITTEEAPLTEPLSVNPENEFDLEWAKAAFRDWYVDVTEIIPFRWKTTRRIHASKKEFEFIVFGFHGQEDEGRFYNMVYAVEIFEIDGSFSQRLDGFHTLHPYADDIDLEDYNNDGYLDIRLHECPGGSMMNEPSLFWLWDARQNKYIENKQLEEISKESWVSKQNGELVTGYRASSAEHHFSTYTYIDNEFVVVEDTLILLEIVDGVNYHITKVSKLIDGKMQLVSEAREKVTDP